MHRSDGDVSVGAVQCLVQFDVFQVGCLNGDGSASHLGVGAYEDADLVRLDAFGDPLAEPVSEHAALFLGPTVRL